MPHDILNAYWSDKSQVEMRISGLVSVEPNFGSDTSGGGGGGVQECFFRC